MPGEFAWSSKVTPHLHYCWFFFTLCAPCCRAIFTEPVHPQIFAYCYTSVHASQKPTSPSLQPGRARAIARWGCKFLCPADEGLTSNARREACVFCTNEFTKFLGLPEGLDGYRLVLPYLVANLRWPIFAGVSNIWITSTWKQRDILPSKARYEQTFLVSLHGQAKLHRICITAGSFSPCAPLVAEQSLLRCPVLIYK